MTLLFLVALATGVVLFILFPVFARHGEVSRTLTPEAQERKNLSEQKERLYDAIKDLDFEHGAGKLSDADYQSVRADLVAQAAAVISQIDALPASAESSSERQPSPKQPKQPKEEVTEEEGPTCASCGQTNPAGAKFCFQCGERIAVEASCPECGTELPKEARFCTECGVAIPA